MGNCLVTKLKGVVDNDNLPVFGELKLHVMKVNPNTQICVEGVPFENISVVGGTTELTPVRTPFDGWISVATAGNHTLKVQGKYDITQLYDVGLEDEEDIKYITGLTTLKLGIYNSSLGLTLDSGITTLGTFDKMPNLSYLYLAAPKLTGNITDLLSVHANTLETIVIVAVRDYSKFTMLMSDLGKFPNILNFDNVAFSPIQGSIESFVASQRGVGKMEKSMNNIPWMGGNGKITWKGTTIENVQQNLLSWTATTITFNGETIQNSDVNP